MIMLNKYVADDGTEQTFTFVGCFPADKPKYAVSMVVQRKHKLPASPAMVSDKVNELIEQREQSRTCSGYAESREKKTEGQLIEWLNNM